MGEFSDTWWEQGISEPCAFPTMKMFAMVLNSQSFKRIYDIIDHLLYNLKMDQIKLKQGTA